MQYSGETAENQSSSRLDIFLSKTNQDIIASLERSPRILALYAPIALLFIHCFYYMPFISDDSFISMRYAQRLLKGFGLTWTEGPVVEGYSNLSWVLLTAALGSLGIDLIDASRILGITCMVAILFANYQLWGTDKYRHCRVYFATSQWAFALSAPIAVWAIGGLEQPLLIACLAWAITYTLKYFEEGNNRSHLLYASFALGILSITRPDAPLFAVAIAFSLLLALGINRQSIYACLTLAIIPILMYGGQLAFRLYYYGEWVPNTALVKVTPGPIIFLIGLAYVSIGFLCLMPFSGYAIAALRSSRVDNTTLRMRRLMLRTILLLWCLYLVFIGGDIFPAFRHLVVAVLILVMAFPLLAFCDKPKLRELRYPYKLALLFVVVQIFNPGSLLAKFEKWEWDGQVLSLALKKAFADKQPLFAVSAAGTYPYFSEFPVVDMLGLNDYYLPRNPPPEKSYFIGHTLGDGQYVIDRQPDLIAFCIPGLKANKPCFVGERQLMELPEFTENYVPVVFEGTTPYSFQGYIWVNKYSEKIGVQQQGPRLTIPAYLFKGNPEPVARLNQQNQFEITLPAKGKANFDGLALPVGKQIDVAATRAENSNLMLAFNPAEASTNHSSSNQDLSRAEEPVTTQDKLQRLDLQIKVDAQTALTEVVLVLADTQSKVSSLNTQE